MKNKMKRKVKMKTPSKFNKYLERHLANEFRRNHPSDHIIGNKDARVETRTKICSPEQTHLALFSTIEPNYF
jgi:hypothetical protein